MLPDASTLLHWVSSYGYPFLGGILVLAAAGLPLPIEIVLLALGGLSATPGGPGVLPLAALGIAATVAGDALDFGVGRLVLANGVGRLAGFGLWVRGLSRDGTERGPGRWRPHVDLQGVAEWSGSGWMIFLSRCVLTPLEAPLSLLAGARGMRFGRFLIWDALGEAVYVLAYLALGYSGAAALAESGPLMFLAGGAIVLATCGPLVAVRLVARRLRGKEMPVAEAELLPAA